MDYDYDDAPDLLGHIQMPVRQQEQSLLLSLFYSITSLVILIGFLGGCLYVRHRYNLWNEDSHKKAIRRKYGIPDDNNEPFNVAYAKVMKQRKDEEQKAVQGTATVQPSVRPTVEGNAASGRQENAGPSILRSRAIPAQSRFTDSVLEAQSGLPQSRLLFPPQKLGFRASHNEVAQHGPSHDANRSRPSATAAKENVSTATRRKRALDKDDGDETSKKSRKEPAVIIDLNVPNVQDVSMDVVDDEVIDPSIQRPKRGAKRQADPVEDISNNGTIGKKAGKRARKQSRKVFGTLFDKDDEGDQSMDLDPTSRGKKRDRAEAESSFGGDDDSPGERSRKSRRQKRKSATHMDVDVAIQTRGTKRSFDVESTLGSDGEDGADVTHSKASRKRGRRMVSGADDSADMSLDEPATTVARDSVCEGRRIGEEWQANGQLYKVGPDGRRLRQVLVKKRRSRFSMPTDSQHPDTQSELTVLVETWLNDNDFKEAEERGDVFPSQAKMEDSGEVDDFESPIKAGKQLLWSTAQKAVPVPKKPFRHSIVTTVGFNVNPFERPSLSGYNRRTSMASDSFSPLTDGSPSIRQSKSYSKWEKQDLEAEAMAKLRKKLEEEESKATTPDPKKVSFHIPPAVATSSGSAAPSVVNSFSAPASILPGKPDGSAPNPSTNNMFAPPASATTHSDVAKAAVGSSSATESSQPKPPMMSFASTQPAKEQSSAPDVKSAFGTSSPAASLFGSKPDGQSAGTTQATPSIPIFFGNKNKSPDTTNTFTSAPSTNLFVPKPTVTPTARTPAPSSATPGASDLFSIKGAAQADKPQPTTSNHTSAFGTPSGITFPSAKPAGEPSSAGGSNLSSGFAASSAAAPASSTVSNGAGTGGASSPFAFMSAVAKQTSEAPGKPAEKASADASSSVPRFNFGFAAKPAAAATPSPASTPAPTASEPPKVAPAPPPFKFNVTPPVQPSAAQNATESDMDVTSSAPSTQPSQAAMPSQQGGNIFGGASNASGTSTATMPSQQGGSAFGGISNVNPMSTGSSNASSAPKIAFRFGESGNAATSAFGGSAKPATASPSPSPFGGGSSAPNPFGSAASGSTAQSSFGSAVKPATFPPFGVPSSSNAPSAFAAASPSPFGAPAKPAGDAPRPLFGLPNSGASAAPPAGQPAASAEKTGFSFNFGTGASAPAPASSAPAQNGGGAPSVFGVPSTSSAPSFSFGSAGGASNAFGTKSAFGAPAGAPNANSGAATNAFGSGSAFGSQANGGQK